MFIFLLCGLKKKKTSGAAVKSKNAIRDLEDMQRGGEGTGSTFCSPLSLKQNDLVSFWCVKVYKSVSPEGFTSTRVICFFQFGDLEDVLIVDWIKVW